ncbi:tetratricopeptide repeat protein [Galbibacter orientalis DSM 19592]|uniref:Tetratricopeptide repeat protein n=1 Tax=Galbibacter orientalis DSM 19592 TaxID=926559 RepID=I3C367_9FLAO|nr:tetratricopeptide repeat protein [Galbibacter orientalis]EIJ38060.1 tetratricopeptide repeat protein [Galbibacter orientalis DSM 19592]
MKRRKMKSNTKIISIKEISVSGKMIFLAILGLFSFSVVKAQDTESIEKAKQKALNESVEYTYKGNEVLEESSDAIAAEMEYRKAVSKSSDNAKAKYNLGNVYYKQESMGEAFMRYKEAGTTAKTKEEKHSAYHNLGNVFMKNKEHQKAVEAYKEALRNDPADEETRYNLALAKEMLKKQQDENKNNQDQNKDDKQDENKDNQDQNQDNKDNQDKKDGDEGDEKKDDQGKEDDKNSEGDNKDEQGENPEDQKQDEGKNDKQDQKQNPGDKPQEQQQQPRPNQLSPQQVKNILEAMNNEEKKVQEKINAEKVKGAPVKSEKDW